MFSVPPSKDNRFMEGQISSQGLSIATAGEGLSLLRSICGLRQATNYHLHLPLLG